MHTTQDRVIQVLAETITGRADTSELITPSQRLREDLHCDSLEFVEIAQALEDEFNIRLDDDDMIELQTVKQLIDHVANVCTTQRGTPTRCVTHHHACDCREQKIATQNKAALDAARLLDHAQAPDGLNAEEREECASVRDRLYAACEALYPAEDDLEQARRLIGASGIACCAEEAAHQPA